MAKSKSGFTPHVRAKNRLYYGKSIANFCVVELHKKEGKHVYGFKGQNSGCNSRERDLLDRNKTAAAAAGANWAVRDSANWMKRWFFRTLTCNSRYKIASEKWMIFKSNSVVRAQKQSRKLGTSALEFVQRDIIGEFQTLFCHLYLEIRPRVIY